MLRDDLIIGARGERDPRSIPLATRQGMFIENQRLKPRTPAAMRAAVGIHAAKHPKARLRSACETHHFNCFGMVFGCRRTAIDPEQWPLIRDHDGYRLVARGEEPVPGDIMLYQLNGKITHVAQIYKVDPDIQKGEWSIEVISKWGSDGEYLHAPEDVPLMLGSPNQIWTERE